ncbi:hypothetical protein ARMGADRAFT_1006504 [Armillaria gallica]|uniref:Mid2 domain-containing protein n=1 Tax=Armillaria gallica TaxID=47427 RepID=A0A2H3EAU0_ARMGA|nr:hypothetical protein ARMGADRAFT_1006504 [Armillaria gallica]
MLRRRNDCPEAFGGDPSLTCSFNSRSEYYRDILLSISGRGEADLQKGTASCSTANGETKMVSSSSNGDTDNPPGAASRSSFDSYGILGNRDFGGGDTSLGDGVRAGGDGIDIGFGTDSIKGREDKRQNQGGGSSTGGHHHHHGSGHPTQSKGSNASPSQTAKGGKKSNSKGASGGGGVNDNGGGVNSPHGSESSPQAIPNTTPNPTGAQTRPTATSASIAPKEGSPVKNGDSSPLTTSVLTSLGSLSSITDTTATVMYYGGTSVESLSSLQSALTSVGASSHSSSIGRNSTALLGTSPATATTAMISPTGAGYVAGTKTNISRSLVGGIIGGIIAFFALLTLLVFLFVRKRQRLRIPSSLFNFDIEKFVGAKRSAESVVEARVSTTSATHLVSPTVVKWEPAPEWGDDRCHDDEVFKPTRASRDQVARPFQDAAHARTSIISDPFAYPVPVVEDPFHDPARESRHAIRDSGTSSLAMSYEEGTVQEASRVPIQRLGSSVLSFNHDTFAIGRGNGTTLLPTVRASRL